MTDRTTQHKATLAARALGRVDEATGEIIPPIHMATTLQRDENYEKRGGRQYIRDEGHAFTQPEALLAALEGGADAMLFSAGIAACTAAFQALAPGDHVVAPDVMYHGVTRWLQEVGQHWGLDVDFIPAGDLAAIPPDKLGGIRFETHPSVQVIRSAFPIVTIWTMNRGGEPGPVDMGIAEAALVGRPAMDVEVRNLPGGGGTFLLALIGGARLEQAADQALADDPEFDLANNISGFLQAGVFSRILPHDDNCDMEN